MTLVCGGLVGPYLHPNGRRSVAERLAGLGVSALQSGGSAGEDRPQPLCFLERGGRSTRWRQAKPDGAVCEVLATPPTGYVQHSGMVETQLPRGRVSTDT
ncbi:UNVERIFIED_CONTAM: hypothetical protein RKD50_009163 [Streptomyces canus]